MAENIYELFPLFLITYFTQCVCVWYRINLSGEQRQRGRKAVKSLGIHQVHGMVDIRGLRVCWPQTHVL